MRENDRHVKKQVFFLQAIALSLRNIPKADKDFREEFLHGLDFRIQNCAKQSPDDLGLQPDDHLDLQMMADALRHFLTTPDLALSDPPQGSTH